MDTSEALVFTSYPIFRVAEPIEDQATAEAKLISLAQRGDLNAFNQLVLTYQEAVYRQAMWMMNEEEAAEDATQEAFLNAYRKLHTFHGGPFRPWILRIVTNYCLDQIRAATRRPTINLDQFDPYGDEMEPFWMKDPAESPEQFVERAETNDAIAHAIQRLSPEYRTAVILIDLQELDYQEVSTILGVPLGTLKSRVARARAKLRDDLLKGLNCLRMPGQGLVCPTAA